MADVVPTKEIYEGEGVTNFARIIVGSTGADIQHGDITTITLNVYDISSSNTTPTTAVDAAVSITIGDGTPPPGVIFNTLQTTSNDAAYSRDDDGYNFKHTYDGATTFDEGGKLFLLEYKFVLSSLPNKFVYFRVKTIAAWSQ